MQDKKTRTKNQRYTILTPLNYHEHMYQGYTITEPSKTIPDQTLSIAQIMERYAKGLPIGGINTAPIYDEESDGINYKTLDQVDIQEMMRDAKETIRNFDEYKKEYEQRNKEENKNKQEKEKPEGQ